MKSRIRIALALAIVIALLAALKCSLPAECNGDDVPRYCVEN